MNYEEMLNSKEEKLIKVVALPIGVLYKKMLDKKYVSVIDLHHRHANNPMFIEAIAKECEAVSSLSDSHQIHFLVGVFDGSTEMLTLEQGNFLTFEQQLIENPSIVGRNNFIGNVVSELLDFVAALHKKGIYHICFSPTNVFLRKGDTMPLLISHGSFYLEAESPEIFFAAEKDYVAPEVLKGDKVDERSDVYSLGKFIEYLFTVTDMPLEYKKIVKKATKELPDERYDSVEAMSRSLKNFQKSKQTVNTFIISLAIALLCVGVYFEFMPQTEHVEFVGPAKENITSDGFITGDGVDITTDLDTVGQLTKEQEAQMKMYQEKCEKIFRKKYEKETDRILSKIYNSEYMGPNEKKFVAGSQAIVQELVDVQNKLAEEANLDQATSQRIASEIIDKITEQKKNALIEKDKQK